MRPLFINIALTSIAAILLVSVHISCNKGDTTSKTVIKCVTCANGGLCIHDTCQCPAGYEGLSCQTLSYQKFVGSWRVTEKGSTSASSQTYTISINGTGSATTVTICRRTITKVIYTPRRKVCDRVPHCYSSVLTINRVGMYVPNAHI